MEPMIKTEGKREVASFVPYRKAANGWEFFLQKRSVDAPTHAGLMGLFGGSMENGETPEEGLLREVREELAYVPKALAYFTKYETSQYIRHVYIEEVAEDFETKITIGEGDYGKFIAATELKNFQQFSKVAHAVIPELADMLSKE
jgi:8-oxo-dGTP diphosphatase